MSRKIDATKFTGFPLLLKWTANSATIVDIEKVAVGDELLLYGASKRIDNIVEQRQPKGDYGELTEKVTLYKLELS